MIAHTADSLRTETLPVYGEAVKIPPELDGQRGRLLLVIGAIVQAEARVAESLLYIEREHAGLPLTPAPGAKPDRRSARDLADDLKPIFRESALTSLAGAAGDLFSAIKMAGNDRNEAAHSVWIEDEDLGEFAPLHAFFIGTVAGRRHTRAPDSFLPLVDRFDRLNTGVGHLRMLVHIDTHPEDGEANYREAHVRGLRSASAL